MKKISTLLLGSIMCLYVSAQINSSLNNKTLKAVNDKVMMTGNEALSNLIVNPNPTTSST